MDNVAAITIPYSQGYMGMCHTVPHATFPVTRDNIPKNGEMVMEDRSKGKKAPSAIVLPFGKHKGSTVAELLAKDPAYAEWVANQGWVAERFAELHAAILSRGAATDDSPEHNAIQVRFLDETFRMACLMAAFPGRTEKWKDLGRERITKDEREEVSYYSSGRNIVELKKHQDALADLEAKEIFIVSSVKFEQRGIDVEIFWDGVLARDVKLDTRIFLGTPSFKDSPGLKLRYVGVEIKPTMGDDFPSVMRQMSRLRATVLVVGEYTGRAVSEPQLRQMFEANNLKLLFVRDIEAEIANARAELA
jgi:hypothetical protein